MEENTLVKIFSKLCQTVDKETKLGLLFVALNELAGLSKEEIDIITNKLDK